MRLAEQEVNDAGGVVGRALRLDIVDDEGDRRLSSMLLHRTLGEGTTLIFMVGGGSVVPRYRLEIQEAGALVLLLSSDLYTSRELFNETFQSGVPWRWQAGTLIRYLVVDRGYRRILAVSQKGPEQRFARESIDAAMREEGVSASASLTLVPNQPLDSIVQRAMDQQAVVFLGSAEETGRLSKALSALSAPPQLAASSEALSPEFAEAAQPGTVAPYPYTWAGWADVIPRVGDFRRRFQEGFGRFPAGFEQEGYDAVRIVADGLSRTGGEIDGDLVRAVQRFRNRTYSSLPIRFGPDDRTAVDEGQLGLFAVPAIDEDVEPWLAQPPRWRPLMRTFTFDGEKTNILDRDKRIFFPRWRKPRPSPKYWRSLYGIVTRPGRDPLH
jgi:branched-chain amino acid transport system substrate-binding protein